jgi:hypothetical protein
MRQTIVLMSEIAAHPTHRMDAEYWINRHEEEAMMPHTDLEPGECTCHREAGSHELCCGHEDGRNPDCPQHGDGGNSGEVLRR